LIKNPDGWFLRDTEGVQHGRFDWVISTAPSPQTMNLLPKTFSGYSEIEGVEMEGCFCLMLGLSKAPEINWQASVVKSSCIGWIAIDSSKVGRGEACSVVVHSSNKWAERHIDDDQEEVEKQLFSALEQLLGGALKNVEFKKLHRWRYANTLTATEEDCLFDSELQLGVCGDWLIEGHVESAFLSALALSKKIIPRLVSKR
jgi:renalase